MTTSLEEFVRPPRVEPRRDRWGRYLVVPPEGGKSVAYTRATTLAETLDDRHNLEKWMQRMVAIGLTLRPDLYAAIAAAKPDDRAKLNQLCDEAREAAGGAAGANLGTALHTFTERIDCGEDVKVPVPWDADIAAWREALCRAGVSVVPGMVERIAVVPALGVAGTFDRLVEVEGERLPVIGDLKTGATLEWSWRAIAVQCACYARAETIYDPGTCTHEAMPQVDLERALVVHLPAGQARCDLYWVDIAAGWEAAQQAAWVRDWRGRKDLASAVGEAPGARRAWLAERVLWLREHHPAAAQALAAAWPTGVPTFKFAATHSADEVQLISTALEHVEAAFTVPFAETIEPAGTSEKEHVA